MPVATSHVPWFEHSTTSLVPFLNLVTSMKPQRSVMLNMSSGSDPISVRYVTLVTATSVSEHRKFDHDADVSCTHPQRMAQASERSQRAACCSAHLDDCMRWRLKRKSSTSTLWLTSTRPRFGRLSSASRTTSSVALCGSVRVVLPRKLSE